MRCILCQSIVSPGSVYCASHEPAVTSSQASEQPTTVATAIRRRCGEITDMLVAKNLAYGNSATDPVRVFSRAEPDEQLRVRIDDKLSRIARGNQDAFGEDVILDLIGYLVLLLVYRDTADQA
jgi:hypothetical protein